MHTFGRWVTTPENHSALQAVRDLADSLAAYKPHRAANPLYVHGPAGTGKTHLVHALIAEVTRQRPELIVNLLSGDEIGGDSSEKTDGDLLVVEDLQHLRPSRAETLVQLFDGCQQQRRLMIFTAQNGPGHLTRLPRRVTSRLASGLVVGLKPLSRDSRLLFLRDRVQRRQLPISQAVLSWLADHLAGSGRQLEGAVTRLEALVRANCRLPDVGTVAEYFQDEVRANSVTVERIARRVGQFFNLDPRLMQSRRRNHHTLLPRQISMYLARRLTPVSLEQIGNFFGGRDHSTVLHACRKIEEALANDVCLHGTVQRLQAELA